MKQAYTRRRFFAALAAAPLALLHHEAKPEEPDDLYVLKERTAYHTELLMRQANKQTATDIRMEGHAWALQIHERRIRAVEDRFPGRWPRTDGGSA